MKSMAKAGSSGKSANSRVRNSGRGKSAAGRLSNNLLHDLRNNIPVRDLIENELGVRCETESGVFWFECPVCCSSNVRDEKPKPRPLFTVRNQLQSHRRRALSMTKHIDGKHAESAHMVIAVKKTEFRQSADFLVRLLESGPAAKPAEPAQRPASDLASLSSVFSAMAEPPPDGKTAERRVRSLEKEVAELKSGMDRLRRVVGAILTQRGDAREIFAKTDG